MSTRKLFNSLAYDWESVGKYVIQYIQHSNIPFERFGVFVKYAMRIEWKWLWLWMVFVELYGCEDVMESRERIHIEKKTKTKTYIGTAWKQNVYSWYLFVYEFAMIIAAVLHGGMWSVNNNNNNNADERNKQFSICEHWTVKCQNIHLHNHRRHILSANYSSK